MEVIRPLVPLASQALSYAIVGGSFILKVPQIAKILKASSAEGVSLQGQEIETIGYVVSTSWGLARGLEFKDFGESAIISIQAFVLVLLVGYYQRRLPGAAAALAAIASGGTLLTLNLAPPGVHETLLAAQVLFTLSSRVPQIYVNYKHKSTGQLAAATYILAGGGSAARIFTTFMNVSWAQGKATLLLQFTVAAALNAAIILQMAVYSSRRGRRPAPGAGGKDKSVVGKTAAAGAPRAAKRD